MSSNQSDEVRPFSLPGSQNSDEITYNPPPPRPTAAQRGAPQAVHHNTDEWLFNNGQELGNSSGSEPNSADDKSEVRCIFCNTTLIKHTQGYKRSARNKQFE